MTKSKFNMALTQYSIINLPTRLVTSMYCYTNHL